MAKFLFGAFSVSLFVYFFLNVILYSYTTHSNTSLPYFKLLKPTHFKISFKWIYVYMHMCCWCCCYCYVTSVVSNLCNPIDGSPPGSPVPGILQARTLEWVAISFSNAWKWKVKVKSLSPVGLFATPWTAACITNSLCYKPKINTTL